MAYENKLTKLRKLAGDKGYLLTRAPALDCWFLVQEATGEMAVGASGRTAFTVERAMVFLEAVRERPKATGSG